ncbi:MAG: HAMP domain-containing protein, partial [Chloroflexota bacterium]
MRPDRFHPPPWHNHTGRWHGRFSYKRRFLFMRFAGFLVIATLGVWLGLGFLAFVITRQAGYQGNMVLPLWLASCGAGLIIPLILLGAASRVFRSLGGPLATIMVAADAVADGDLSVQVPEHYPGEFGQLARSFNRMTRELANAEQQRRNLTADVAHELRTPLHILQGNLEAILDGVYEPGADQINAMLDETRLMARLVDDLRTMSLAESGQ